MFSYSVFAWLNYSFHLFLQYFFVWIFTYYPCSMYFATSFCIHNFRLLLIGLNVWRTMEMLKEVKNILCESCIIINIHAASIYDACSSYRKWLNAVFKENWHLIITFWYMLFNMFKRKFFLSNMNAIDACNVYWVRRFGRFAFYIL